MPHQSLGLITPDKTCTDSSRKGQGRTAKGKGKQLANFYTAQNEHIQDLLKPLAAHTADGEQGEKDMALKVKLAVNISFGCNIVLAGLQLYAAVSSGSLALFATAIDSGECVDLCGGARIDR